MPVHKRNTLEADQNVGHGTPSLSGILPSLVGHPLRISDCALCYIQCRLVKQPNLGDEWVVSEVRVVPVGGEEWTAAANKVRTMVHGYSFTPKVLQGSLITELTQTSV